MQPPGSGQTGVNQFCLEGEIDADFAWHSLINGAVAQAERQFAHSLDSTLPFAAVLATLLSRYPEQVVSTT